MNGQTDMIALADWIVTQLHPEVDPSIVLTLLTQPTVDGLGLAARLNVKMDDTLVQAIFATHRSLLGSEPEILLACTRLITKMIDREVPGLASVDGAGWLSAVLQGLPKVSLWVRADGRTRLSLSMPW
jgi:hypothetical protein